MVALKCVRCQRLDVPINIECATCSESLDKAPVEDIFAALRQFASRPTQKQIQRLGQLVVDHPHVDINAHDPVNGMNILHFAIRAGTASETAACEFIRVLADRHVDINCRTLYTQMTPLHLAAYYGLPLVTRALLSLGGMALNIDAICPEMSGYTALHIAAVAGYHKVIDVILQFRPNRKIVDNFQLIPLDSAYILFQTATDTTTPSKAQLAKVIELLQDETHYVMPSLAPPEPVDETPKPEEPPHDPSDGKIRVGDRVLLIQGSRGGVVKYVGPLGSKREEFYGVYLDKPQGRNNGSYLGVAYFKCPFNHGAFVPIEGLKKVSGGVKKTTPTTTTTTSSSSTTSVRRPSTTPATGSPMKAVPYKPPQKTTVRPVSTPPRQPVTSVRQSSPASSTRVSSPLKSSTSTTLTITPTKSTTLSVNRQTTSSPMSRPTTHPSTPPKTTTLKTTLSSPSSLKPASPSSLKPTSLSSLKPISPSSLKPTSPSSLKPASPPKTPTIKTTTSPSSSTLKPSSLTTAPPKPSGPTIRSSPPADSPSPSRKPHPPTADRLAALSTPKHVNSPPSPSSSSHNSQLRTTSSSHHTQVQSSLSSQKRQTVVSVLSVDRKVTVRNETQISGSMTKFSPVAKK